jgi:hypothetical protein
MVYFIGHVDEKVPFFTFPQYMAYWKMVSAKWMDVRFLHKLGNLATCSNSMSHRIILLKPLCSGEERVVWYQTRLSARIPNVLPYLSLAALTLIPRCGLIRMNLKICHIKRSSIYVRLNYATSAKNKHGHLKAAFPKPQTKCPTHTLFTRRFSVAFGLLDTGLFCIFNANFIWYRISYRYCFYLYWRRILLSSKDFLSRSCT